MLRNGGGVAERHPQFGAEHATQLDGQQAIVRDPTFDSARPAGYARKAMVRQEIVDPLDWDSQRKCNQPNVVRSHAKLSAVIKDNYEAFCSIMNNITCDEG